MKIQFLTQILACICLMAWGHSVNLCDTDNVLPVETVIVYNNQLLKQPVGM